MIFFHVFSSKLRRHCVCFRRLFLNEHYSRVCCHIYIYTCVYTVYAVKVGQFKCLIRFLHKSLHMPIYFYERTPLHVYTFFFFASTMGIRNLWIGQKLCIFAVCIGFALLIFLRSQVEIITTDFCSFRNGTYFRPENFIVYDSFCFFFPLLDLSTNENSFISFDLKTYFRSALSDCFIFHNRYA